MNPAKISVLDHMKQQLCVKLATDQSCYLQGRRTSYLLGKTRLCPEATHGGSWKNSGQPSWGYNGHAPIYDRGQAEPCGWSLQTHKETGSECFRTGPAKPLLFSEAHIWNGSGPNKPPLGDLPPWRGSQCFSRVYQALLFERLLSQVRCSVLLWDIFNY